jgi:hypothetical protein
MRISRYLHTKHIVSNGIILLLIGFVLASVSFSMVIHSQANAAVASDESFLPPDKQAIINAMDPNADCSETEFFQVPQVKEGEEVLQIVRAVGDCIVIEYEVVPAGTLQERAAEVSQQPDVLAADAVTYAAPLENQTSKPISQQRDAKSNFDTFGYILGGLGILVVIAIIVIVVKVSKRTPPSTEPTPPTVPPVDTGSSTPPNPPTMN